MAATGMKLDTRNSRGAGIRIAVMRMVIATFGLMGVMTNSLANDFAGLADPTRPAYSMESGTAVGSAARPTGPMLQSTFISVSQRRAVISGKSYTVGDKFGGGTITDIQPYEVVLKKANRETRLRLLPKLVKQAHMVKVPVGSQEGGQNVDK
jgi:hypothetical protein